MTDNATLRLDLSQNNSKREMSYVKGAGRVAEGGGGSQLFNAFTIAMFAGAVLLVVTVIFLVTRSGGANHAGFVAAGNNCSVITCPAGLQGPFGVQGNQGPPGVQGPSGPSGPQGPQGNPGLPGPQGPIGACSNTNPFCTQGATGPQGPQGIPGLTGGNGLIGPTGPQGGLGPQGFIGPTGPIGLTGLIGLTGPQGPNGTCDCFSLPSITTANLNVTNSITLSGSMTCPGGALDANCFGLTGACPDFSTCYLRALGLSLNSSSPTNIPLLQVGMGADAGLGIVNFGSYPSKLISTFTVYTNQVFSLRTLQTTLDLVAYFANANLESVGGTTVRTFVKSTGQVGITGDVGVTITAPIGNVLTSAGSTFILLNQLLDTVTVSTTNTTHVSADFNLFRSAGVPWLQTRSWQTLTCGSGLFPAVSGTSISFAHDIVHEVGTKVLTKDPSGLITTAGLNLCGDTIKTVGPTLQLQTGTDIKTVDIRAVITNNELGKAVTFINQEGVNFQDTAIRNENGVVGPLVVDDKEGLSLLFNNTLFVNIIRPVNGTRVTVIGDLNVTGTIYGAVEVASPMCCTSDKRAKTNLSEVSTRDDLMAILALPRRVDFQYTPEYQAVDKTVDNSTYSGFIAQELEEIMPHSVYQTRQKMLNGETYEDFRRVLLDRMVPHLVGAVKEMYKRQMQMELELTEMREQLKRFIKK